MDRTASIPAWVARRGWNRKNSAWVRAWLDRKPKADRSATPPVDVRTTATILPFPTDRNRT